MDHSEVLKLAVNAFRDDPEGKWMLAVRTSGRPLILDITAHQGVAVFTAPEMDACPECCEHFADDHVPGRSLDLANQED